MPFSHSHKFPINYIVLYCSLQQLLAGGTGGKEPACQCRRHEMWDLSLGWEDPLEGGMATQSSILAWGIPRTERAWWGYGP